MPGPATRISRILFVLYILSLVAAQKVRAQDTTTLPAAQVGKSYSASLAVETENGKGQLTWSLASGDLPAGLQVAATGRIEGTPASAKSDPYTFALTISDSSQPPQSAVLHFSVVVLAATLRVKSVTATATPLKVVAISASTATASNWGQPALLAPSVANPPPAPSNRKTAPAATTSPASTTAAINAAGQPLSPQPSPEAAPKDDATKPTEDKPSVNQQGRCASTKVPFVPDTPIAGYKSVSGCAGTTNPMVEVTVFAKDEVASCANADAKDATTKPVQSNRATVDGTTGIFSASFKDPLKENQIVCIREVKADNSLDPDATLALPLIVPVWTNEPSATDRGRTRYYSSAGVALSQDNQQFSNQDVFVGFDLQRNWYRNKHSFFNSDFSAQLTSIPTAATSMTTSMSATTGSTTTTPSLSTFISSRKAAVVSGDLYEPLFVESFKWWYDGQSTMFLAPIVKGGLQTITDGALSVSAPAPGTSTSTTTVNNTSLYYFWSAGIRLGDVKLYKSWNIAPEVLSHLDLTVGQWQNFRQCRTPGTCMTTNGTVSGLYQPLLFALQGQLNIPKTPIQIGFSSITPLKGGGQGDLRFFFGVKLDVGCIYKAFQGGTTPKFLECADDGTTASNSKTQSAATKQANNVTNVDKP